MSSEVKQAPVPDVSGVKVDMQLSLRLLLSKLDTKEFRSDDFLDMGMKLAVMFHFINEAKISMRFKKEAIDGFSDFREGGSRFNFESDSAATKVFSLSPKAKAGALKVLDTFDRISKDVSDYAFVKKFGEILMATGVKIPPKQTK